MKGPLTLLLALAAVLALAVAIVQPGGDVGAPAAAGALDGPVGRTIPCTVERVVDGDTVNCEGRRRVRLLLIDAPEMSQKPFGRDARRQLAALAPVGASVRLELDVQERDRYGRTLAYLWTSDGRLVNEALAQAGYVVPLVYPPNVQHVERIRAAVAGARAAKRGLWATSAFECEPRERRRRKC